MLEGEVVLFCCARLVPEKGLVYLLDALEKVRLIHPHVRLVIAGEGPLRGSLEDYAEPLGLHDSVSLGLFGQHTYA